jgi:hypothetical protein
MFGHLLGLRSFDSPKGSPKLAHKQAFLQISFGGTGFIPIATITPTTYLRNWAFVVLIITFKFMVEQLGLPHPSIVSIF